MLHLTITACLIVLLNCEPNLSLHSNTRITRNDNQRDFATSMELDSVMSHREALHQLSTNRDVTRLQLQSYSPPEGLANLLGGRDELEELSLICVPLLQADLQAIARLKNLSRLDLRGCRLTLEQLLCLSRCPALEEIDLRGIPLELEEIVVFRQRFAKLPTVHAD